MIARPRVYYSKRNVAILIISLSILIKFGMKVLYIIRLYEQFLYEALISLIPVINNQKIPDKLIANFYIC